MDKKYGGYTAAVLREFIEHSEKSGECIDAITGDDATSATVIRDLLDALSAPAEATQAVAVPEGWKLVPIKATPEMLAEIFRNERDPALAWYKALAAAPQAPVADAARAEAVAWQPIETAPKTGRTVLLGYSNAAGKWRTVRGQWMSETYIAEDWEEPDDVEPGWFETSVEADDVPNCWRVEPTHWMPLPPEPGSSFVQQAVTLTVDARDAARYRWLRNFDQRCKDGVNINPPCEHVHASMYSHAVGTIPAVRLVTGGELDRAIDAALKSHSEGEAS
ncbi:hypothetical protein [Paraburkholderia caballeronis]|uniref:hypothetical protein n=1 Tax=Paraburkholderia caballeronis TaxID=416943 RepID=UPI0010EB10F4|nr:hypothetical protein [Paraburkholderia caballeronis]TDV06022.1 hypothetical protein C7408_1243 [Paraburkholderia caballeronis]TDV09562.1 hypothetical protein C7406_1263 [Paraburkholderia caballeronis]TDV21627.1 hypothetical protein C7404_1213 [Paraburkholderia caballeronis]